MLVHGIWWLCVALLAGLWSLLAWAAHAVLGWDGWARGEDWAKQVPAIELPDWLMDMLGLQWVQWLRELLLEWGPELQAWVAGLPLGDWASLLLWVTWGLGLLGLLLLGLAGSGVIALVRRSLPPRPAAQG